MDELEIGKVYRHFKGNYYLLLDTALHSETQEVFVVYKALYGDCKTWVRPLKMFLEKINQNKPDNITGQNHRFERVDKIC